MMYFLTNAGAVLPRLNLVCYPASRGERLMSMTYQTFVLKWYVFEKFSESYLDGSAFKITRWQVKRAVRPPGNRDHIESASIDQVFSQLLKSGPRQKHVAWICEEIQRQVPFLDLTDDVWSDDCDLVSFCGILDRKARQAGIGANQGASAMALTSALQTALTGAERLTGDDPTDADILMSLALDPNAGSAQDRGLSRAKIAPDPRRFLVGDQVVLTITPPPGASGQYDLYLWETWNPNSAALPAHERRAPWEPDAKPLLQPLPSLLDQTLPKNDQLSLSDRLTDATGLGWHYIGLVGINRTSQNPKVTGLAGDLRRIVQAYHTDNPADDAGVYDLRTHERLIREVYFFIGRDRLEKGLIGADPNVFIGRCAYEIVG